MKEEFALMPIEKLVAMFVIAMGTYDGSFFEYYPKLPSCFVEKLNFQRQCGCNADFLRLTVNEFGNVECWFIDGNENSFFYSLNETMKMHPLLYTSIVTHIFDMIENVKEC